ncbi:MAG: sugar-binding domain-containing protein, partial [Lentisphaerota bacterium]
MKKSIRKHIGFALLCIFCSIILAKEQETSALEGNVIYKQSFDALEDLKIEPNGNFLIDTVLKQEGKGALHVQWPGNGKTANTSKTIILNVPEFDATDCVVRVWLRYDNISSRQTSIALVDKADKPSYKWIWAHNESCINVWKLLEFHVGGAKQPGGTWKYGPDEAGGDIRKTVAVQITFWALNDVEKGCNGDHYIDGMEIIRPVKMPSETMERLHKFNADSPEVIESRGNDMVRVSYAPLLKIEGSAQLKADKENKGDAEKWFSLSLDDTAWNKGRVGSFWLPENDPVAWYRIRFEAPQLPEGRKISLVFGAVDESAWVWLNGEKLGSHSEDSKDGWDEPFAFDVTGRIKSGKENLLTVKVLNRAQAGGIFRPIVLAEEKNVKVLGSVPVIVKYEPWKDPDVKKAEEKLLQQYAGRRLPVTPPAPSRRYAPKSKIRDREMLFTSTEVAGLREPNSKASWELHLKSPRSVALTLDFSETSFKGAAIKCTVNGMILPAYFALGEDTRYAKARKNPDLSPPESKIQANWVLPPEWAGKHLKIEILNAGPGWTVPERFTVSAVDGDNIPGFQNSVPVSMDIWFRQGQQFSVNHSPLLKNAFFR